MCVMILLVHVVNCLGWHLKAPSTHGNNLLLLTVTILTVNSTTVGSIALPKQIKLATLAQSKGMKFTPVRIFPVALC